MLMCVCSCTQSGEVWLNNGNIIFDQNYKTVKVLQLKYVCLSIFLKSAVKNDDKLNVFLFNGYIIGRVTCHKQFSSRPDDYFSSCVSLGNMNVCRCACALRPLIREDTEKYTLTISNCSNAYKKRLTD